MGYDMSLFPWTLKSWMVRTVWKFAVYYITFLIFMAQTLELL